MKKNTAFEYPDYFARFYDLIYHKLRGGVDNQYFLDQIKQTKGKILEVGVGTGRFFIDALTRDADIYGFDISSSMIDVLKTKLNKLLFFSDFKHFKNNKVSITGSRYVKIKFGPVPDKWRYYLASLIEEGALDAEEIFYDEDITGEKLTSARKPDLSIFSEVELITLASVKNHFKGWTATRIRDFSHNEKGYKDTPDGQPIPYRYAEELQI